MPASAPPRGILTVTILVVVCVSTFGSASIARAQDRPSTAPLPNCLDQSIKDQLGERLRPRGVQKRVFLKNKHLEVVAHGGLFASDLLSSSYLYGGAVAFWLTEDLALEARFDVSRAALDLDAPIADFFGDDRFEPGAAYLLLGGFVWAPVHAKLKIGGSIVHSDIMLTAGAGRLFHDSSQGIAVNGGVIMQLYLSQWLTLRFDLRNVLGVQEAVAETRLGNNVIATMGLSFWIPTPL